MRLGPAADVAWVGRSRLNWQQNIDMNPIQDACDWTLILSLPFVKDLTGCHVEEENFGSRTADLYAQMLISRHTEMTQRLLRRGIVIKLDATF